MNVEQPLEGGTILYQKPTPKQDKGGGIFPTAEGARVVLISRGRQNAATLLATPSIARPKTAGNPRLGTVAQKRYEQKFSVTHCNRIINIRKE